MTHNELLDAINRQIINAPPFALGGYTIFLQALCAVAELHKPSENDSWGSVVCVTCPTWEYPCQTIQAIEKELSSQP